MSRSNRCITPAAIFALSLAMASPLLAISPTTAFAQDSQPFLPDIIISSTVPADGDGNPYGVVFVPEGFPSGGPLAPGDILVSNFNSSASSNAQGTGTTIIKLTPNGLVSAPGNATTFFQGTPPLGLTTALGVLKSGFVLVGNVPTSDGVIVPPGSLLLLDRNGNPVSPSPFASLFTTKKLNGPWDLTIDDDGDHALVFVSNVNNGTSTGTVTRLNLAISSTQVTVQSATVIASGYTVELNSAALILGPTGLAYDKGSDSLYIASTADNKIFKVESAATRSGSSGTGTVVFQDEHLRGPLALVFAPNGDLLTSNGDAVNDNPAQPSEIVEFTPNGKFVTQFNVDAAEGGAFGIGVVNVGDNTARLAVVDDNANDIIVIDRPISPDN